MAPLFSKVSLNFNRLLFEYGFVLGHHLKCSTKLLNYYYAGLDYKTNNIYFKTTEFIFGLFNLKNFFTSLNDFLDRYKFLTTTKRELFNFILVFSERDFSCLFFYIFETLAKAPFSRYLELDRYVVFNKFRFYFMVKPTSGFITNCTVIHNDRGGIKYKGMPEGIDFTRTIFVSFGDYTLYKVVKSVRANLNCFVMGVVDSNQYNVLDSLDYVFPGNDDSFKFFSFFSMYFLKIIFNKTYISAKH